MIDKAKADLIRQEAENAEQHPDLPEGTNWTRRNRGRSTVYSVRLNPEEVAQIEAAADELDVPASTLVRGWVLNALAEHRNDTVTVTLSRMQDDLHRIGRMVASLAETPKTGRGSRTTLGATGALRGRYVKAAPKAKRSTGKSGRKTSA